MTCLASRALGMTIATVSVILIAIAGTELGFIPVTVASGIKIIIKCS
jgi:hypothetical protein